ncbi:MAG: hypothetical protein AABM30_02985 [Actinomycetota bacterium]
MAIIAACAYPAGAAADPPFAYAAGSGAVAPYNAHADAHFSFTAHDGSSGVTGRMQLRFTYDEGSPTEQYSADVVCLTVVGNDASLTGVITRVVNPTSGLEEGDFLTFQVTDNGQPGSSVPDEFRASGGEECPLPTGGGGSLVTQGNINVNQGDLP